VEGRREPDTGPARCRPARAAPRPCEADMAGPGVVGSACRAGSYRPHTRTFAAVRRPVMAADLPACDIRRSARPWVRVGVKQRPRSVSRGGLVLRPAAALPPAPGRNGPDLRASRQVRAICGGEDMNTCKPRLSLRWFEPNTCHHQRKRPARCGNAARLAVSRPTGGSAGLRESSPDPAAQRAGRGPLAGPEILLPDLLHGLILRSCP
jgi:hypothetical protein